MIADSNANTKTEAIKTGFAKNTLHKAYLKF